MLFIRVAGTWSGGFEDMDSSTRFSILNSQVLCRYVTVILFTSLLASCKNSPTQFTIPGNSISDTTGHQFVWTIQYFGDGGSKLNDIHALSKTDVFAVGRISNYDSTGNLESEFKNVIRWNGTIWEVYRLWTFTYPENDQWLLEKWGVFGLSWNDLWVTPSPMQWIGNGSWQLPFKSGRIGDVIWMEHVWGRPRGFYFARNGTIYQGLGQTFVYDSKLPEGFVTDIFGNENEVWICTSTPGVLYHLVNGKWVRWDSLGTDRRVYRSVWVDTKGKEGGGFFGLCGEGVKYWNGGALQKASASFTPGDLGATYRFNKIRGSSANNVFAVGDSGLLAHYNGSTWHIYPRWGTAAERIDFQSVSVAGDMVFIAGTSHAAHDRGLVLIGKQR